MKVTQSLQVRELPSSAGGGVAEGRGGVVKLSFTTDLVPNLQPSRGMKRRRFIYNPKTSRDYRRELRSNLTPAEALLWRALKNSSLEGKKFRRQHGIGPYIADFYCPECRVIVELDGAVHKGPLEIERDETRTTYLKELGIRVMRFENRAVFESLEMVLNSIRIELQETGKGTGIA